MGSDPNLRFILAGAHHASNFSQSPPHYYSRADLESTIDGSPVLNKFSVLTTEKLLDLARAAFMQEISLQNSAFGGMIRQLGAQPTQATVQLELETESVRSNTTLLSDSAAVPVDKKPSIQPSSRSHSITSFVSKEYRSETPKRRYSHSIYKQTKSRKKWLVGSDASRSGSRVSSRKERMHQSERTKNSEKPTDQESVIMISDTESKSSKDEDLGLKDNQTKTDSQLSHDLLSLKKAFLMGVEQSWSRIIMSYLSSARIRQENNNASRTNIDSEELRSQAPRTKIRIKTEVDYRDAVQMHFKYLVFGNDAVTVLQKKRVPWKNLGIWLFQNEKRFTKWSKDIPFKPENIYGIRPFVGSKVLRKVLLIDLEDWTEDEKRLKYNSEIPLVVDPKNRTLVRAVDVYDMFPSRFCRVFRDKIHRTSRSKVKCESSDSVNHGPSIITLMQPFYI